MSEPGLTREATAKRDLQAHTSLCAVCDEPLPEARPFCPACGTRRPRPRQDPPSPSHTDAGVDLCPSCGAALGEGPLHFCRLCGHHLSQGRPTHTTAEPARASSQVTSPGLCQGCGRPLLAERKFCTHCGAARSLRRGAEAASLHDPAWYSVVSGLSWVFAGTVMLVSAALFATAAITLLALFSLDKTGGILEVALLGLSALTALAGLGALVWGDLLGLRIPARGSRPLGVTTLVLSLGAASLSLLALGPVAMTGFAPDKLSHRLALLSLVALLLMVGRYVAFALLLRRVAFTLRHYRIAQGSVGFIVYLGVGLAVVGLLTLLFRSAPQTARTFAELLTLAFAAGTALWIISMTKRARDLVRQRLS